MSKNIFNMNMRFLTSSLLLTLLFTCPYNIEAKVLLHNDNHQIVQSYVEYKGKVIDAKTKEPLIFADITLNSTNIRTVTNKEGEFLLKVPNNLLDKMITIALLGYEKREIPLTDLKGRSNRIALSPSVTQLSQVRINVPKDAETLVRAALDKKGGNYYNNQAIMTAFYRETIKKRRTNASLTEAVVEIYKEPYASNKSDAIGIIKARKNTNYSKLDTLALKLQGGPFSALYSDIIKYPEYIFTEHTLPYYSFSFEPSTEINDRLVYVVKFEQKENVVSPLYYGRLFIDSETFALTSAIYNLNVENKKQAGALFLRKKPRRVRVYPTQAAYRVDYKTQNGKWYYGYSNIQLAFNVKWKNKLFSSTYTLNVEMAITDWEQSTSGIGKPRNSIKPSIILSDEASGFSDPKFWGEYNIIEPEKSIESAIKKIVKQIKRTQS